MDNKETEYLMKFAERLKQLRLRNDMTQEILAEKLSVSVQLISKWENAKSAPTFFNMHSLSDMFEVSLDYLTGKSDVEKELSKKELETKLDELREMVSDIKENSKSGTHINTNNHNSKFQSVMGLANLDASTLLGLT